MRTGLVVVDADRHNEDGPDGVSEFENLALELGLDLSTVPQVDTPSGGKHYYFSRPSEGGISNSAGKLATAVDIRADGGYVIAPGAAREDGRSYTPLGDTTLQDFIDRVARGDLPQFPAALKDLINRKPSVPAREVETCIKVRETAPHFWRLDDAANRLRTAPEGTRNDGLNREAFIAGTKIAEGLIERDAVVEALSSAARMAGLPDTEIDTTLTRALMDGYESVNGLAVSKTMKHSTDRKPKASFENALAAVRALGITIRRDTFADVITVDNATGSHVLDNCYVGTLTNNALVILRKTILEQFKFDPGKEHLFDAIATLAEAERCNPVTNWIEGLHWDGIPRVKTWLPPIIGTDPSGLNEVAGFLMILGMVARAFYPGTKFDQCIVFEGPQGIGKSTFAHALTMGPDDGLSRFTDAPGLIGMDTKTRAELIGGKWLVELAELSGLAKSEMEQTKAFISQSSDQFRPPYARVPITRPRTCIFIATTNGVAYLIDPTGNRRFLPIACKTINMSAFMKIRDQLFAEAHHILQALISIADKHGTIAIAGKPLPDKIAEKLALPKTHWKEAADIAEERRVTNPLEEYVQMAVAQLEQGAEVLDSRRKFIKASDLIASLKLLGAAPGLSGLADWMSRLGWSKTKIGPRDRQSRGYVKNIEADRE